MKEADEVIVRTAAPASVRALEEAGVAYTSLDALYARSRNYDTLTKNMVREIRRRAKGKNLCYCVDGGVTEDACARILLTDQSATFIEGVSKAGYFAAQAGLYGGFTAVSAFELEGRTLALPLVVYDLTEDNAGSVKLALAEKFGDEAPAAYIAQETCRKIPLYEADRQKTYGEGTGLVVYDLPLLEKKKFSFEDFVAILRRLRAPDGCPWDRVQTHESIRINCIEEAYELVDAIDRKDPDRMLEETGDVLMQAVFHALIEEERGGFTVNDMLTAVSEKLITRHTHVWGQDKAAGADGALSVWDKNKMKEKHQETYSDAVNDVPECFPALLRAQKVSKRIAKGGWDFSALENIERKLQEEYGELMEAYAAKDAAGVHDELGDFLMCAAWLCRAVGADGEMALADTVKKVQKRYTAFETLVLADGKDPTALSAEEWREYYKRAKDASRG